MAQRATEAPARAAKVVAVVARDAIFQTELRAHRTDQVRQDRPSDVGQTTESGYWDPGDNKVDEIHESHQEAVRFALARVALDLGDDLAVEHARAPAHHARGGGAELARKWGGAVARGVSGGSAACCCRAKTYQ